MLFYHGGFLPAKAGLTTAPPIHAHRARRYGFDPPSPVFMKTTVLSFVHRLSRLALVVAAAGPLLAANLAAQTASPSPVTSPTAAEATATPIAAATPVATPATKEDLVGTLKQAGNFKTFLKAAEAAGLLATLQKPGPYTVFAPTDAAFAKLTAGTLDDLLKPENKAKLVTMLSYHISATRLTGAELAKADEIKTLEGTEIDVDVNADGKTIELDEAKVLGSGLEATNGVVHAIDTVLQP